MIDFNDIKFDNEEHSYVYKQQKFISVTTLISRVKQPFDKEKVANNIALRDSKTKAEVLEEWERSGEEAREKGTLVHRYIEDTINLKPDNILNHVNLRVPEMEAFDKAYVRMSSVLNAKFMLQEVTVGDLVLGLAGRVDCLLEVTKDEPTFHIFDWKTGKKFDIQNNYAKMLPPFDDLDDCAFNHYSIQTSIYRLILERNPQQIGEITTVGKKFGDSYLLHLKTDGTYQLHRAKDFRSRISEWLNTGLPEHLAYDNKDEEYASRLSDHLEAWNTRKISPETKARLSKAIKNILYDISKRGKVASNETKIN